MSAPLDSLTSWRADWEGLGVVVLGLGPIGFSVVDTLAELGARVTALAAGAGEYRELVSVVGAELVEGEPEELAERLEASAPDVVVATPPYGPQHPAVARAIALGIPIWSDVELAWRVRDKNGEPAEWITVTGSAWRDGDGASTPSTEQTTLLTAAMIAADGRRVLPAGAAVPVLDAIRFPERVDVIVVEISSLQLAWTGLDPVGRPRPTASACLSVGPEPVGWHESLDDFRAALGRVYEDTVVACVYSLGDVATQELVEDAEVEEGCRAIGVGLGIPGLSDFGIVDGLLVDRAFLDDRRERALEIATLDELALLGVRTPIAVFEVLAAAALARSLGVSPEAVQRGVAALKL